MNNSLFFLEKIVHLWKIRSFLKNGPFFNEQSFLKKEWIVH